MNRLMSWLACFAALATLLVGCALGGGSGRTQPAGKPCGGPPNYCATTSRGIIHETPMNPPPVNAPFHDPDFGSRMVRVTDADTRAPYEHGYFIGTSYQTDSSGEANEWSAFDPRIGANGGYRFYVYDRGGNLIPFTMDARTMHVARITGNRGSYLKATGAIPLHSPSFSYKDPDILYGSDGPRIVAYHFSTGRETPVYDFDKCPGLPSYVSKPNLYMGGVTNSGDDTKFSYYFGGSAQNATTFVTYYDRAANGGAGACYWYDTVAGTVGGTHMPPARASNRAPGARGAGFNIHNARLSKDGSWVRVNAPNGHFVFWKAGTTQVIDQIPDYTGHQALGYSHLINDPNNHDMAEVIIRPLANPRAMRLLVDPLPSPRQFNDSHWSWNDADPGDTMPVCGTFYNSHAQGNGQLSAAANPVLQITAPYDREIVCVATRGPSRVWRFAHHRGTSAANARAASGSGSDWFAIPIGNVSQDGRFYLFGSDWDWELGSETGSPGCPYAGRCRSDVFVVELH